MLNDKDENQIENGIDSDPCPVCSIDPALIKCNQVSAEQLCVIGMEQYDAGQLLKAMQYYLTALSLKPDFIPALLGTTCVLVAMERYAEAQNYLDFVFELDPDIKDAKLLRNIINNARSGFPIPEENREIEANTIENEDFFLPEPSLFKKYQPYLVVAVVLIVCYMLSGPFLWGKKAETKTADIAEIRSRLAAESGLKNADISAEMKGEKVFLSGRVGSQAEQRLAMVITEQTGGSVTVDAGELKIAAKNTDVKSTAKPAIKFEIKPTNKPAVSKPAAESQVSAPVNRKNYYTVKPGDILSQIARDKYGDGKYWTKIQAANPGILKDPGDLEPGMVIVLPD